jgi:GTP-binding protein EngB required for normal cell division
VVVVMDIRHPLTDSGPPLMVDWCAHAEVRLLVLLTKSDKLSRGAAAGDGAEGARRWTSRLSRAPYECSHFPR